MIYSCYYNSSDIYYGDSKKQVINDSNDNKFDFSLNYSEFVKKLDSTLKDLKSNLKK